MDEIMKISACEITLGPALSGLTFLAVLLPGCFLVTE